MKAERSGRTALPVRTRFGIGAFAFSLTMRCTADAQNTHEDLMHTIETDRLLLRNFTPDDAADLFDYLHAPGAACFLSLRLEDRDAARREAEKRSRDDEHVAVCLKATGRLVGDLFAVPDGEPDTLSVGWHFNARFGGVGLATEAARALFADLFEARGARRGAFIFEQDRPDRYRGRGAPDPPSGERRVVDHRADPPDQRRLYHQVSHPPASVPPALSGYGL